MPNREWIKNLDIVAANHGNSYLVVCQAPKKWRGEIVDLPIGSRILTAWADTVISINKTETKFRKLEISTNYNEIEPIIYNKDFQIVVEEATLTKSDLAAEILRERWSECKYPNIGKVVAEIAKNIGCSYKPVWDAYRIVKQEKAIESAAEINDTICEQIKDNNGNP
jgi:hypothetical protein